MILYEQEGIMICTIEEQDKKNVLKYFSENNFNCDFETGSLKPSNNQFIKIMEDIISGKDRGSNIFVLRKNGETRGYVSMYVEWSRLNIGHIAVKESERGRGYGTLLTKAAIMVAENEGREVALYCNRQNNVFEKLGFNSNDGIHFLHEYQGIKTEGLPALFMNVEEYEEMAKKRQEKEVESFSKFLDSNIWEILKDL